MFQKLPANTTQRPLKRRQGETRVPSHRSYLKRNIEGNLQGVAGRERKNRVRITGSLEYISQHLVAASGRIYHVPCQRLFLLSSPHLVLSINRRKDFFYQKARTKRRRRAAQSNARQENTKSRRRAAANRKEGFNEKAP